MNGKKTVIFHIGMHKTATSSIQETLETNRDILSENNMFYPDLEANHGHALCSVFWDNPENYYLNKILNKSPEEIEEYNSQIMSKLIAQLMETTADTIVISGEDLCYMSLQDVYKLKYFIEGIYSDVEFRIVAYFREYLSYIISLAQQSIKTGSYYKQRIDELRFKKIFPMYYSKVTNFIDAFGNDAFDAICFEDSCKHKRGPVGYFFSYLGFIEEDIDRLEIKKTNESLSDKAIEIISYINEIIEKEKIAIGNRFLPFNFNVVSGDKFTVDKKTIEHVYKSTRDDAKWLKNTLGIDYMNSEMIDRDIKPFVYDDIYIDEFYEGFNHLTPKYKELAVRFIFHKIENEEGDNKFIFNKLLAKVSESEKNIVNKMSRLMKKNKDKTIYFHIGHPKTGSSAIQAFLKLNAQLLLKKGYYFPESENFVDNFQTSVGNGRFISEYLKEGSYKEVYKTLDKFTAKNSKIVISSELICGMLKEDDAIDKFVELVKNYDYRIIMYMRKQSDYLSSSYMQRVKNHYYTKKPEDFTNIDYGKVVLKLEEKLDTDKIIVRPYEKSQFVDGNIFSDFLDILDLEYSDDFEKPQRNVNPSFNLIALEFMRMCNLYYKENEDNQYRDMLKQALLEYSVENGVNKPFLSNNVYSVEQQMKIMEKHQDINKKIANTFLNREKLFFEQIKANDGESYRELKLKEVLEICEFLNDKGINFTEKDLTKLVAKNIAFRTKGIEDMDTNYEDEKITVCQYELKELPKRVSKHVSDIYYKDNLLYIHSTGNDPHFILPKFAVANTDSVSMKMTLDYSVASYIQVFYRSVDEGFCKERSVFRKVDKGTQDLLIKLKHSNDISELRIDTGGKEGIFIIKELKIYY